MKNLILILALVSSSFITCMDSDDEMRRGRDAFGRFGDDLFEIMGKVWEDEEEKMARLELDESLIWAVMDNDIERARACIAAGSNVRYARDIISNPKCAFEYAIEVGNLEMCQLLIGAGADVNNMPFIQKPTRAHKPTALYFVKDIATAQFLLNNKTDIHINAQDNVSSALQYAAMLPDPKICELYIKAGADVHFVNKYDVSPLYTAIINNEPPVWSLLAYKMLTIPTLDQKERVYTFLWCLKKMAEKFPWVYGHNFRRLLARKLIREENLPLVMNQAMKCGYSPVQNEVLQYIRSVE